MKMNRLSLRKSRKLKHAGAPTRKPSALAGPIAVFAATAITLASAANFWWDSNGVVDPGQSISTGSGLGGAGTYDGFSPRFWDGVSAVDVPAVLPADVVFFGGQTAGGAITFTAPLTVNGLVFTTGSYTTNLTAGTLTFDGTAGKPVVAAGANASIGTATIAGIAGTAGFSKSGGGTLTVLGNNTGLSGSVILNGGTLASSGSITSLGSGDIILQLGTLQLLNSGAASNMATPVATYTNNFFVNGNSTLNVNNAGANAGNTIAINSLSIGNSQLTITNGNTYGLQVVGTTNLAGPLSTINTALTFTANNANPTNNMVAFSGGVTGPGALNKLGTGTVNLFGAGNTYSGGTNIFAGAVTLADSTAQAGTGNIIVNPGAAIAFTSATGATLVAPQTLSVQSSAGSLGIIRVDSTVSDIVSGSSLGTAFISPYGASFQINTGAVNYSAGVPGAAATYTQSTNLSQIGNGGPGNGPVYLGASSSSTMSGTISPASDGVIRFAGSGTLTLNTANQITGTARVTFGSPIGNVQTVAAGGGTFAVNNANALTLPVTINRTAIVQVAGIAAGTENPLGTNTINILGGTLDTTASVYVGASPQLGNGTINVYQTNLATAGLLLNDAGVTTTSTDLRVGATTTLGLYSGNLTFTGSNTAATTTTQNFGTVNASGGSTVNVTVKATPATDNADAVLIVGNLVRQNNGAVSFLRLGATQPAQFGLNAGNSDSRVFLTNINGALPAPAPLAVGGMLAPWLVDGGNVAATITFGGFLDYGANGIIPATYGDTNFAAPAANKITDVTATSAPASTTVFALRIGGAAGGALSLTGTNTITIAGNAADGAGLILNTITAAQTNTPNFTFGSVATPVEAVIYASGGVFANTLSGTIVANGLTKFGSQSVVLSGVNTGVGAAPTGLGNASGTSLRGTITLNQGTFAATTGAAANFRPVTLNAGVLQFNTANLYLNDITINGDSSLDTGTNLQPRYNSLTVNARAGGSTDPVTVTMVAGGLVSNLGLTLTGPLNFNHVTGGNQVILGNPFIAGSASLSGAGALNKFGGGQLVLATNSAGYTGPITINGLGGNNNNAVIRSFDALGTDRPFGTGAITVNPGGVLSISHTGNIASNASVTFNSDLNGLATLAVNYNGDATLPGTIVFNNSTANGPFSGVLAIDAVGYSGAVNLGTYGNGTAFLGSANQTGTFTGTLTPSGVGLANSVPSTGLGSPYATSAAGGVYRIGAGGGTTQFVSVNQFAAGNDIQVGAISNVHEFTSVALANGNGTAAIYNTNAGFSGNVILNGATNNLGQGNLLVGNNGAVGTGTILFNGGGIQADVNTGIPFNNAIRTLSNPIQFSGDAVFNGSTDLRLTANFSLADGQTGVTRTFQVANATGLTILSGTISDGTGVAATNSITKTGAGPLVLSSTNTYTGFTNINAGTIVVTGDASIQAASQITLGSTASNVGGFLGAWTNSFTTTRNYILTGGTAGQATSGGGFDVGAGLTVTQAAISNISGPLNLNKNGLGNLVLNGANSFNSLQVNAGEAFVGANVNLGEPVTNSPIIVSAAPSGTVVPATLVVTGSFSTGRAIQSTNNLSGTIFVQNGVTFTDTGVINLGTGSLTKAGPGTFVTTGTNTGAGTIAMQGGVWQTATAQPFGALTAPLALNGGTILLQNTTATVAIAGTGTLTYGGGGHLNLQSAAGFSDQIAENNINRSGVGTLIIDPGTSTLAQAGNTDSVRVIPNTLINVPVASANVNGILPGSIITRTAGIGSFATYTGAATGIGTFAAYSVPAQTGTLAPTTAASTVDVVGPITALTNPVQSVFGLRTNSSITAPGTLRFSSVSLVNEGGLLVNGSATISTNLIFDPTNTTPAVALANVTTTANSTTVTVTSTAALVPGLFVTGPNIPAGSFIQSITNGTQFVLNNSVATAASGGTGSAIPGSAASGEGLVYVNPGSTATVTGSLLATSFVKFGSGNLTLNGSSQSILGQLTVQEGTLRLGAGTNFAKQQTDLVLNATGTFDLNGANATFNSLGNFAAVLTGLATTNASSTITVASTFGLQPGMLVNAPNIPSGATVQSVTNATTFVISANATASANTQTGSATVAGVIAGGVIGNSGSNVASFTVNGNTSTAFTGNIVDALGGGTGTTGLVKSGTGTLTLGIAVSGNPDANVNTFTGGTTLYGYDNNNTNINSGLAANVLVSNAGSLVIQNPLALGTGAINLVGGILNLQSNGGGINGTILLGGSGAGGGLGQTVNVFGPSSINVDRVGANSGNSWQIGNLNLTENTLTTTGGNSYHLRVNGATAILGNYANINSGSTSSNGTMELVGQVTGAGALNKFGTDASRMLLVDNPANSYSGGTNILSGRLVVNTTTGTPLGTGRVNVFPGGMLSVTGLDAGWAPGTIGGAPVRVHGYFNSLGLVGLDNDNFDPAPLLNAPNVLSSSYGAIGVAITRPFYTRALDQSAIGDGRTFLVGGLFVEVDYIAPTLAPGLGDGVAPRTYRVGGGVSNSNFAFNGADNVFNDTSAAGTNLQVGSPVSTALNGAVAGTGNFILIRNSNSFTGGTTIWKGSAVQIETGASANALSNSPLGSGQVDVWGTLQTLGLNGSFVDATTGTNKNLIVLHPGGLVNIQDVAGTVAGGQGRWADTTGLNLNGGSFQFVGAVGYGSQETMGQITVDKLSRIVVLKGGNAVNAGAAQLNIAGLTRVAANGVTGIGAGALLLQSQASGSLGIPASATISNPAGLAYDRVVITGTAPTLGGSTSIGAGITPAVAAAGMVAPWIINTNDSAGLPTFVTYSPTNYAGNTGFQPFVSTGSLGAGAVAVSGIFAPGANQVGYSRVFGTGTTAPAIVAGLTTGTETVDLSGAATLTLADANTSIYALRTNRDLNPLAGANPSLTIVSGGLISVTTNYNNTINNAPTPNNAAPQNFTINFGTGGNAEAVIYVSQGDNNPARTLTINAQIVATGLTKLAAQNVASVLVLTGDNPLTGPVTINGGILQGQNTLSGIGAAVPGVFGGQNVILGGNVTQANSGLRLDGTVGNAVSSLQASASRATSRIPGTVFVNGDSAIDLSTNTVSQRITNLTFADLGVNKPIALQFGGNVYVEGTTTLGANDNYLNATFGVANNVLGGLVQGGRLTKFGNAAVLLAGTANTYSGGTAINESTINTATSIVGSLTRTGTPFGSGPITINPGGMLRVMDPSNISFNAVSLRSDGVSLGGIAISGNITPAALGTLIGSLAISSTGEYRATVALDTNSWNSALSLAALETAAGGKIWLGSSVNPTQTYFNSGAVNYNAGTLTGASDNIYRLGGGGNQGALAFGVGQFENVFSGSAALQVGASTAGINDNGPAYINGNIGNVVLNTRNLAFTGAVTVNGGGVLTLNNPYALANAVTVNVAGGNLSVGNAGFLPNTINVTGDTFSTGSAGTFAGTINLAPAGVGGTRTIFTAGSGVLTGFAGVLQDGAGANALSNLVLSGNNNNNAGLVVLHGANTYHGTTTVLAGLLYAGTDVLPNVAGAFGISDTPVALGNAGAVNNSAGQVAIAGQFTFGRDIIALGKFGNNINLVRGQTVIGTSVITGGITTTDATVGVGLALDNASTAGGVGGVLDVQGPIVGLGGLQIGSGGQGIVRLSANSQGIGTNTYAGSTNVWGGRLQIASDTNFTGTAATPTIISGPLGAGTLFLGRQGTTTGGAANQAPTFVEVDAFGGDRTIENALGAINQAGDTTINFGGHNSLTFVNAASFDLNTDGTVRSRTMTVLTPGTVTFNSVLSNSSAVGVNLQKSGIGTIVLTGTNTHFNSSSGDGNYGSTLFINAGVASVSSDANLGAATIGATAGTVTYAVNQAGTNLTHAASSPTDVRLRGGVLQITSGFSTNRSLIFGVAGGGQGASSSGIDVLPGQTFTVVNPTLNQPTAPSSVTLTKIGGGTLAFTMATPGALNNTIAALVLGGFPGSAGTVSTNALSGVPIGSSSLTIDGGTVSLVGTAGSAQALIIPTVEFRAGSAIQLNRQTTGGSQLTATALSRGATIPQGTLTLLPSTIANLGAGAAATSENVVTSTAYPNLNNMLVSPIVDVRLAGVGQDANYVQYGANGFTLHTNAGAGNNSTNPGITLLADITAAAAPLAAAAGANTAYAVRTANSITDGGASNLISTNGGLILNRNTASGNAGVTISTQNLTFGAVGAPLEGIIYVADGTTSTPTISSAILATNLTKSGPGNLLLSGTGSVMAPTNAGTGLRVLQINDGTLSVAGQASLPSGGQVLINPMDNGTFDVAGQSLTIGGLGGGVVVLANLATTNASANATVTTTVGLVPGMGISGPNIPAGTNIASITNATTFVLNVNATATAAAGTGGAAVASTGTVTNSGAASTLTFNESGTLGASSTAISAFNGLLSGNIAVVKSGTGTQILGANNFPGFGGNPYTGGTTVNAGTVTSGSGVFTGTGTLSARGINSLGTGAITLQGGTLEFNNAIASNEIFTQVTSILQGGNNGYDVTVPALNNFGSPNTTSAFSTASTVAWQAINSLTVNAPVMTWAGTSGNGVLVKGTTTFNQDTILNTPTVTANQAVFAGTLTASGRTLTKIGAGTVFLTGAGNGTIGGAANSVGAWNIFGGTVEARTGDGGSNSLGTNSVTLNGGTLAIRHDGDNLSDAQNLTTFIGTNLTIGSTIAGSSASYISSANATFNPGTLGSGANKTIQFGQVQFGGPLGAGFLSVGQITAGYQTEFTGGLTMIKDAYLSLNNNTTTISAGLSGNGTLFKQGAAELDINTVATNTGGTVLAGGTTNFGNFRGNTRTLSTTAMLAGNITVQPGALIRFNATSNVNGGQIVDVRSNLSNFGVVGIGDTAAASAYNVRVPQAFGAPNSNLATALNAGSGVLAVNSQTSQPINLSTIGDGTFFLGSNNNGAGIDSTTSVNGTLLGAVTASPVGYNFGALNLNNTNSVYRLGGGGAFLNVGLIGGTGTALGDVTVCANPITNVAGTTRAAVVVGAPLTNTNNTVGGATVGNGTGTVFFNTAQTYTGNTLVNRGSTLEFRSTMATSSYDNFGTLAVGGAGGTFAGGPTPIIRPGATVRLDNSLDLLPVAAAAGRWGDTTAVGLDSGTFQLTGAANADIREVVGQVNAAGGSTLTAQSMFSGRISEINGTSIVRTLNNNGVTGSNGLLSIQPVNGGQLGSAERVTAGTIANYAGVQVSATNPATLAASGAIQNGMVAPWMTNNRDSQFLTYSDFGFVNAGFNYIAVGGTSPIGTGTERALFNTTATSLVVGGTIDVWALRADIGITLATATDASAQVMIRSGGLISTVTASITPKVIFGTSQGTPSEAIINTTANTLTIGDNTAANRLTSGQIFATNITKGGAGALSIDSPQPNFLGNWVINQGTLQFRENVAVIGVTQIAGGGAVGAQNIIFNGYNATLNLRSDAAGALTLNQNLVINAGNANATINTDRITTNSTNFTFAGGLTFGGAPGDQGQTLSLTAGNSTTFSITGATNLGPAGNVYFNLTNANTNNPAVTLAGGLTGLATLVREGSSTGNLNLGTVGVIPTIASTATGGVIMNGNIGVNAASPGAANGPVTFNQLPSGNLNFLSGQLTLRVDGDNSATNRTYSFASNTVTVTGNSTIALDRITANGGTVKTLAFPSLTIGGQTLAVTNISNTSPSTNTFSLRFDAVALTSTPTFNTTNDLVVSGVTDNGGGLYIAKNGGGQLWFDDRTISSVTANAVNTFTGGVFVNQGTLRFGNVAVESAIAQAGTGLIQVNASGAIRILDDTNIAAGQQVALLGIAPSLAVFRFHGTNLVTGGAGSTQGNLQSIITAGSTAATLRMESVNLAQALDMALIGDGTLFFSTSGTRSYTADTLGVGAGATYRLGANDAAATVLTLAPVTPASPVLTGANKVVVGSLGAGGAGTILLNQTNDFSGGATIARGSTLQIASGLANTPLGSGQVDVFGTLTAQNATGSFINAGTTANNNAVVLHPGGTLRFENNVVAANNDRWFDTAPIVLNGSTIFINSLGTGTSTETVGSIGFALGSRIQPNRATTAGNVTLTVGTGGTFNRVGNGTMVFVASAAGQLGSAAATNAERVVVADGAASVSGAIVNGMLPAYYVSSVDNSFVTYGGNGFTPVAFNNTNFAAGFTNASLVDVTAATALAGDASIYALRVGAFTVGSAASQLNTITLNGGAPAGVGGGVIFSGAGTIATNLNFNGFEGLIYTAAAGVISGDISGVSSAGITKFGTSSLAISKDQSDAARGPGAGYANGWTVNEGTLIANTFGSLGNAVAANTVTLNGNPAGVSALTLNANQGTALNAFYSMGNLLVTDNALITHTPGAADRTQSLGAAGALSNIVITSTGGALLDAQLAYTTNQQRSMLLVGNVSVVGTNASVILNIAQSAVNNNLTSGSGSGVSVASLIGSADQTIKKWGNAELYVRGASTFAGAVSIEQGTVGVFDNASLGSGATTVRRYGALDIQVANYVPSGSLTYAAGSIERWSVDGARTGALNLAGATLQIANDQTGTVAITLNGGSIEGFLRTDDNVRASNGAQGAVYRTAGANVSFTFAGNSFVGQDINLGVNGLGNGAQPNVFSPTTNALAGVMLEIKGAIGGPGSLTKQGFDTVTLSGANSYAGGTNITQGILRIGATNSLPTSGNLTTVGSAALDLNGFNQTIGRLVTPVTTNNAAAGYITNTATTLNTLTVNSATDASYSGVIQYNVALTQSGTNKQTLTNANTYVGPTNINGGTIEVKGSIKGTSNVVANNGGTLLLNSSAGASNIVGSSTVVPTATTKTFTGNLSNADFTTNGSSATLAVAQGTGGSGTTNSFCALTLNAATTTFDFSSGVGTLNANVNLIFGTLASASKNALIGTPTISLAINNWTGADYSSQVGNPSAADIGNFGDGADRLLFTTDPGFGNGNAIPGITFNGLAPGMQVQFGSMYEIVPVPEPATTALLGSVALCALLRCRGRQRSSAVRARLARK